MRKRCLATVVGDRVLHLFMKGNINKPGQVEKGRGRGASLEQDRRYKAPPNGRGKQSGEKGETSRSHIESEIETLRRTNGCLNKSLNLTLFLPHNLVGVTESYHVGGQGSLKVKQV